MGRPTLSEYLIMEALYMGAGAVNMALLPSKPTIFTGVNVPCALCQSICSWKPHGSRQVHWGVNEVAVAWLLPAPLACVSFQQVSGIV